jgi:hypothetical protein
MSWLWFIIAIVLFAVGVYALGRWDTNEEKVPLFWVIGFASLLWPFVLAAVIIFGPFVGLYFLGEYQREKKAEKNSGK